jgi:hypothetical protein
VPGFPEFQLVIQLNFINENQTLFVDFSLTSNVVIKHLSLQSHLSTPSSSSQNISMPPHTKTQWVPLFAMETIFFFVAPNSFFTVRPRVKFLLRSGEIPGLNFDTSYYDSTCPWFLFNWATLSSVRANSLPLLRITI